jgi:hypothetical protein
MPELERMLEQLREEVDWPRTPDLAGSVMARIAEEREAEAEGGRPAARGPAPVAQRRRAFPLARRSLALAFAILLLLAGAAFAALPGVRDAVRDFLGLQGATVERREQLPQAPPRRPLDLGARTTLPAVTNRLAFVPLLPAELGDPDAVYVRRTTPGGELSLAYRPRAGLPRASGTQLGLLVSEFRGDLAPEYVGKIAGQATTIERLHLDGDRAIWVAGAPHFFFYRSPGGRFLESELRLANNVLLLERGNVLVRLEGAFGRERALAIARSLR